MFSTCTLAIRIGMLPRWMAVLGYTLALLLLLTSGRLYVLLANLRSKAA